MSNSLGHGMFPGSMCLCVHACVALLPACGGIFGHARAVVKTPTHADYTFMFSFFIHVFLEPIRG